MEMQVLGSAVGDTVTSDGGTNVDVAEWKAHAHAKIEESSGSARRAVRVCSEPPSDIVTAGRMARSVSGRLCHCGRQSDTPGQHLVNIDTFRPQ